MKTVAILIVIFLASMTFLYCTDDCRDLMVENDRLQRELAIAHEISVNFLSQVDGQTACQAAIDAGLEEYVDMSSCPQDNQDSDSTPQMVRENE